MLNLESYMLPMRDIDAKFVRVDKDTDANVRNAAQALSHRNFIFSKMRIIKVLKHELGKCVLHNFLF